MTPACGEQQEHGVIAFEPSFYLTILEAVRDHFAVRGDLPLPPRRPVGLHRDLKHARAILFHLVNMRPESGLCQP
jgi:hypothetical protein